MISPSRPLSSIVNLAWPTLRQTHSLLRSMRDAFERSHRSRIYRSAHAIRTELFSSITGCTYVMRHKFKVKSQVRRSKRHPSGCSHLRRDCRCVQGELLVPDKVTLQVLL